ncbi:MAG: helicase-related protein, partial [Bacteroidales bacterium]|nr:helicase-related protein [Bacteroidales bacterium]
MNKFCVVILIFILTSCSFFYNEQSVVIKNNQEQPIHVKIHNKNGNKLAFVLHGLASDMTPYDEVQRFDVANFDKQGIDAFATAQTVKRETEVADEVKVAKQRIKRSTEKKKSLPSPNTQLNLFDNPDNNNKDAREQDTTTNNRGTQPRREELPETESVEPRTPLQHAVEISRSKRGNTRTSGNQLGDRPLYDVNKNYSNEEISQIVSSVTDIVDGRVVITAPITDDIRAICHQYKSGGVAKKGHGILDEYYTDGKIVDAVSMLITPYFNNSNAIRVLEPSVGVGNFISAVDNIPTSEIVTFEINPTTARIAKILYPGIDVNLRSFETEFIDDAGNKKPLPQKYNLIIGNPPYGSHRGLYKGLGEESKIARYEDYFVKRSLDVLNEGGILAMVLPSSWIDRHTRYGGYTIEAAYRLPSGAFEATQVGTDIVVLRKDSSIPTADHTPYFEQHPERVLGEVKQRKGRYGKMEDYVQGDIDTAIETIKRDHASQIANRLDIAPSNDNLNNIEEAIDETGSPDKATAIVQTAKTETNNPAPSNTTGKKSKYKTELNRGVETVPTSQQFTHTFSEGEVEAFYDTEYDGTINHPSQHRKYANYIGGRAMHDFYYAEGDIYAKLDQLEREKEEIITTYGQEQYDKQRRLLMSVLPQRKGLSEITISPNTTFVKNLYIDTDKGSTTLRDAFIDFCKKLPYQAFGDSSSWEVRGYVDNEQVYGQDKERNALVRERRKRVANDLFVKFLNEELSQTAQNQVVAAFNREYNSTYRPDYSRVPMFSTINKDFRGNPLKLTSVQLAGIGRMTVKGVGVLAHEVGFGKTLSGILAMHEAMTRGFATKPLIVVPNDNILKQWVETIKEVLPHATVNTLGNLGTSYDLTDFKVNDGEFTLVTYEGLKAMSFSDDTYNRLAERFSYITEDLKKHQSERDIQKEIEKKQELKGKMKRGAKTSYGFEDFGFDWLTVDEVHNCNHIVSKVRLDKSVSSDFRSQNQRTSDLGLKTWLAAQYIQEENNGRNVLLLSATPFTNKPLEYYSILSLVGNKMLKSKGFFHVDQFFSTFMEADNELEIGANGRPTQKTNVRRFRNNGLFQQLLSEFIDIKGEEDNPELVRPDRHNKEYKINPNELTEDAMAAVQDLLNDNDTVLQGIGHARQAAFSPYATSLLGIRPKNHREFVKNSPKINATIKLIEQNKKDRPDAGQIIYSEVGVEFFPMIRDYLVNESGFKPSEVRIITGATSNAERVNIQSAFNKGEVKVVIGSPAIKEGLNLQENTTDMYILSLPWNFTQLRQIEGRGWRQGNKWENIRINYMLTNNSVDVFMLQRLQLKQGLYNEA